MISREGSWHSGMAKTEDMAIAVRVSVSFGWTNKSRFNFIQKQKKVLEDLKLIFVRNSCRLPLL
tara:strand:- start:234 stop:425 length:192 start_codon:yes stop_codon:yes gene_type:complete